MLSCVNPDKLEMTLMDRGKHFEEFKEVTTAPSSKEKLLPLSQLLGDLTGSITVPGFPDNRGSLKCLLPSSAGLHICNLSTYCSYPSLCYLQDCVFGL